MTRLVRCKEGMLRTKKGEQKCFQRLDSNDVKANGTEIIRHMAQLELKKKKKNCQQLDILCTTPKNTND